ncbi:hypothetical protein, partial [Pseudomonas aeruginosa]
QPKKPQAKVQTPMAGGFFPPPLLPFFFVVVFFSFPTPPKALAASGNPWPGVAPEASERRLSVL